MAKYTARATQAAMPTAYLTVGANPVSGDQNASTNAAASSIPAAPEIYPEPARAASMSA